jgi:membrane dipeptidase
MQRRNFLKKGLLAALGTVFSPPAGLASPRIFASAVESFSAATVELVRQATVVDALGLVTTDWSKLGRWRTDAEAFTDSDWELIASAGVSVFHPAVHLRGDPSRERALRWMNKWKRFVEFHPDRFHIIYSPADVSAAKQSGRIGILLGMQNSSHFHDVDDIVEFYAFGQRLSQLTYNQRNRIGYGCRESLDRGLTPFGVRVVEAMRDCGMLVDVSHCGPQTSLDAIEVAGPGVVISHSNCSALVPGEPRCKSDELIRKLGAAGGLFGVTAISKFTRSSPPVTVDDLLDHFDHLVSIAGVEHVALGSDAGVDGFENYLVPGLNCASRVYQLTEGLLGRGYSVDDVQLILGGNFQRVFSLASS